MVHGSKPSISSLACFIWHTIITISSIIFLWSHAENIPSIAGKGVLKDTKANINQEFSSLVVRLLSAPANSASVECIFSNFCYIHNKFRNRLGTETSAKLVFCYRMLPGYQQNEPEAEMSMTDDDNVLPLASSCDDGATETQKVNSSDLRWSIAQLTLNLILMTESRVSWH